MKYITIVALLIFCASCKEVPAEIKSLQDKAIAIHDDVMPKMSEIRKLSRKVKKVAREDESRKDMAWDISKQLDEADEAMMNWMAEFKKYSKLSDNVDPVEYYRSEIERITNVQDLMLKSIADAKTFLSNE